LPTQAPCGAPWRPAAPSRARSYHRAASIFRHNACTHAHALPVGRVAYSVSEPLEPEQCPVCGCAVVVGGNGLSRRLARARRFLGKTLTSITALSSHRIARSTRPCSFVRPPARWRRAGSCLPPRKGLFGAAGPFYPPLGSRGRVHVLLVLRRAEGLESQPVYIYHIYSATRSAFVPFLVA
jgi:hypothetical protein